MATLRAALALLTRALVLAALTGALIVGTTFAGKPGGGTSSTFNVADGAFAATTIVSGGTGTWAHARCYQNGALVYEQYVRYSSSGTGLFTLGPTPSWTGGAASCNAEDGWWQNGTRWRVRATDTFSVSA
jgi:hypothetical protein